MTSSASLKVRAYREILSRILTGRLVPGDLLNRRSVAAELGMSMAPVHEAMVQLECGGFLEAMPRQGTRVKSVRPGDIYGHLVLREALEVQLVRMVCGKKVSANYKSLLALVAACDSSDISGDQRAAAEVDFHLAVAALCDCESLVSTYRDVMQKELFYRINMLLPSSAAAKVASSHGKLLRKLRKADCDQAAEYVRHHIWSGKDHLLEKGNVK